MQQTEKITLVGILCNTGLFILKLIIGLITNSLAIISDAVNSLSDIVASTAIFFAVKKAKKKSDASHPFGHYRFEAVAGFLVAVIAAIAGFEVIRYAIHNLINPQILIITNTAFIIIIISILVKILMAKYFIKKGNKLNHPAIKASGVDSFNDVLVSSIVLFSLVGSKLGWLYVDSVAAIIIGLFILYNGAYKIGMENIDYLVGKAPSREFIAKVKKIVMKINGIKGINEIKAHYVGHYVHIEIHIEVNKNLSTKKSHDIGKEVQRTVEHLSLVDRAFIHIDPL